MKIYLLFLFVRLFIYLLVFVSPIFFLIFFIYLCIYFLYLFTYLFILYFFYKLTEDHNSTWCPYVTNMRKEQNTQIYSAVEISSSSTSKCMYIRIIKPLRCIGGGLEHGDSGTGLRMREICVPL